MNEIKTGLIFTGKWFTGKVEVLDVDVDNNTLKVKLQSKVDADNNDYHWFEDWNLEHTEYGFQRGDYFLTN